MRFGRDGWPDWVHDCWEEWVEWWSRKSRVWSFGNSGLGAKTFSKMPFIVNI